MELPRERLIEIAASVAGVTLMVVILAFIGRRYTVEGEFTEAGGLMLVVAIMLFVLLMAALGYALAFTVTTSEAAEAVSE